MASGTGRRMKNGARPEMGTGAGRQVPEQVLGKDQNSSFSP